MTFSCRSILRVLALAALVVPRAAPALAQNWDADARRIALGGVGTAENIASRMVQEEEGYRAIVLPFGLLQVLPEMDVFNPGSESFSPVCAIERAASPLHYTLGRKPCDRSDPGYSFANDIFNGRLSRDLNAYRRFRPASSIVAGGLANPTWGKTFAIRNNGNRTGREHGVYVGAGPYLSVTSQSAIDPLLVDILSSATVVYRPNGRFAATTNATTQMAYAITGGYRGRLPLRTGSGADGIYVAANYHHLRGIRFDRFDLGAHFDTDANGLLTLNPTTTPVALERWTSGSGRGFALDMGVAVLARRWTFGAGASGIANRINWNKLERDRFTLESLVRGGDFLESPLPPPNGAHRVTLPVNYTTNLGYRADRWSAESEFSHGMQGGSFHGGLEYRLGAVDLRGGGRYARGTLYPSAGAGFNLSPRIGFDIAGFGTSANIERRRDLALAVSMRIMPQGRR